MWRNNEHLHATEMGRRWLGKSLLLLFGSRLSRLLSGVVAYLLSISLSHRLDNNNQVFGDQAAQSGDQGASVTHNALRLVPSPFYPGVTRALGSLMECTPYCVETGLVCGTPD